MFRPRLRVRTEDGRLLKFRLPDLYEVRVELEPEGNASSLVLTVSSGSEVIRGPDMQRVLGLIMSHLNAAGGTKPVVEEAVDRIEIAGPARVMEASWKELTALDDEYSSRTRRLGRLKTLNNLFVETLLTGGVQGVGRRPGEIARLPAPTRLALEMVLHEEQERVALEGELAALETAWREAEEIAAIADNLLVPSETEALIARHRDGTERVDDG